MNVNQHGLLPSFPTIGSVGSQLSVALCYAMGVVLLLIAGVGQAQNNASKPLVVGSEQDFPPFSIGNTDEVEPLKTKDV